MQIDRADTMSASKPPEATFAGDVTLRGYFMRAAPSRLAGTTVAFAPRARTPWKVNPVGQTLIVTGGVGWTQCEGEDISVIRPGDIIWYPPGQRHWDGATPDHTMTCVVVHEAEDGSAVEFLEAVSDEDYLKGPPAA